MKIFHFHREVTDEEFQTIFQDIIYNIDKDAGGKFNKILVGPEGAFKYIDNFIRWNLVDINVPTYGDMTVDGEDILCLKSDTFGLDHLVMSSMSSHYEITSHGDHKFTTQSGNLTTPSEAIYGIDEAYHLVKEFHKRADLPTSESQIVLGDDQLVFRSAHMMEEIVELMRAEDIYSQVDAVVDLLYFAIGTLVEMGVSPGEAFQIVHEANMNKISPDGVVNKTSSGKIIKPEGWEDPKVKIIEMIDRKNKGE
jgi:predicted HAD superfamily Cof-like phosphohydrolase